METPLRMFSPDFGLYDPQELEDLRKEMKRRRDRRAMERIKKGLLMDRYYKSLKKP
jgi:hypothetical protein